jgi:P27 family predicted phage terminase small subunit
MTHLRGVKPTIRAARDPITKAPNPPAWLTKEAKAEWKRVLPYLVEAGYLVEVDLAGITNYCVAVGRVQEIEKQFQAGGFDTKLFGVQNRAMQTARQLAAEFGISPVARSRLNLTGHDDEDDDNPLTVGRK